MGGQKLLLLGYIGLAGIGCSTRALLPSTQPASLATDNGPAPARSIHFCAGTVTEHEIDRCIWELTPEQQQHRPYSQRLELDAGRLVRMSTISGSGNQVKGEDVSDFSYHDGQVSRKTWLNRGGFVSSRSVLDADGRTIRWYDAKGRPKPKKGSRASGLSRKLDERGRVLSYAYIDDRGQPAAFEQVYEVRVKRNTQGAIVEESFFGAQGEPVLGPAGAHRVQHAPDGHGVDMELRYFDATGAPALAHEVHLVRMQVDSFGNEIMREFFDRSGRPVVSAELGAASLRITRDAHGNELARELFDVNGRPTLGSGDFATRRKRFDDRDLPVEWSFFGADGAPRRLKDTGCPLMRQTRDAQGNVVAERFYDENAQPMTGVEGYHRVEISYDGHNNPTRYRYTDVSGRPVMVTIRYHERTIKYDGDRPVYTAYFDTDGRPTTIDKNYAAFETVYLDDGSEAEKKFFDVDGQPLATCKGYVGDELKTALQERAATTRTCYEALLESTPAAAGKLMLRLQVAADGHVLTATVESDDIARASLSTCTLAVMSQAYPVGAEGGECADVRVPLVFRPKK